MEEASEPLLVPAPVLPEVDYVVSERAGPGPFLALLRDIDERAYAIADLVLEDYARSAELMDRYDDLDVGFVDAAVLALTERLGEPKLATLDRRHFSAMRPRHVDSLQLVP